MLVSDAAWQNARSENPRVGDSIPSLATIELTL
jgi:hypothetical protein